MRNKTLDNKGVALVTVVLIFLVLVTLLAGVMFASVSNQKNAILSKDNTTAYYTAESGLNLTVEKIDKYLVDNNYGEIPPTEFTSYINNLNNYIVSLNNQSDTLTGINPSGTYLIQVSSPAAKTYTIKSIGTYNGVQRTIEGTFSFVDKLEKMAKAVITKSSITMANNATIEGPIASLMVNANDVIDVHGCPIGEVYVPDVNSTKISVGGSCNTVKPITSAVTFNSFTLPTYYTSTNLRTVTFSNGTYTFPELNGKLGYYVASLSSSNMTFNLGTGSDDRIIKLYVNSLSTSSGTYNIGDINVIGNGKLMVLITLPASRTSGNSGNPKYQFSWDGNVNVGNTDLSKFQLVIKKGTGFPTNTDPTFTIPNNLTFVGSILADYVNVQFGNLTFKGFIGTLGKSFKTTSNATITGPMWVYAPNADVSINSNSLVNGSIISNSVNITSGGTIRYQGYEGELPFQLNLPAFMGGELVPVGITYKFNNFKED